MDVSVSIQNDDVTCHRMGITAHVERYGLVKNRMELETKSFFRIYNG